MNSFTTSGFPFSTNDEMILTLSKRLGAVWSELMTLAGKDIDFDNAGIRTIGSNSDKSTFLWTFTSFSTSGPFELSVSEID